MDDAACWSYLGQDVITIRPVYKKPASNIYYADPTARVEGDVYYDIFGVPFRKIVAMGQTYVEFTGQASLAGVEDVEGLNAYAWPTTEDWDYSSIPERLKKNADKATWARSRGVFQTAQMMRGFDGFLMDLIAEPEYSRALLDHIYAFVREDARKTLEAGDGKYTFVEYNDDVAMQTGMMMSPALWRKMLRPYMEDFCQMAHAHSVYVRYHSCGSIAPIIEDIIECGVDILDPVQPLAANMDPFELKKKYGDRLCFHGGLDIQNLLPNGKPAEVRAYVKRLIHEVGREGGYILAGSHTLQMDAKVENIVAAVDTVMGR
jgi:uroporphyrinogen decarboxylase